MIKYFLLFSLLFCPLFGKTKQEPKYYVSICSLFRDEARFLKEWIEYHRMVGVEHFYLFNHLSEDGYEEVLRPYIEKGIVELFHLTKESQDHRHWYKIQTGAYNKIIQERTFETFWLAVIDSDEFIVPITDKDFPSFLRKYEDYGGVCIHWQIYGTSGNKRIPEDQTMIGTLLKKAHTHSFINTTIKSIIRPPCVKHFHNPHFAIYKKKYFQVDEQGVEFTGPRMPYIRVNTIRINHYIHRDEDFYYFKKITRPRFRFFLDSFPPPNPTYYEVEDPIMLKYVPELEHRLFGDFDD